MGLIKCYGCNKEISAKVKKCVHCGCDIKREEKRKRAEESIQCTECNSIIERRCEQCPNCGNLIGKRIERIIKKTKRILSSKKVKIVGSACVVMMIALMIFLNNSSYSQYTKYLGKSYKELPKAWEQSRIDENEFYLEKEVEIGGVTGKIVAIRNDDDDAFGSELDRIETMRWEPRGGRYVNNDLKYQDVCRALERKYGKYDERTSMDASDLAKYLEEGEERVWLTWLDQQGVEINISCAKKDGKIEEFRVLWYEAERY